MTTQEPSLLEDFLEQLRSELAGVKFPSLAELATIFIAAVSAVVGMGAALLWIRVGNAGLPQLQALTLIPQQEFILLGARELALPMLFWSTLNVLLFTLGMAKGARRAKRKRPSRWAAGLAIGIPRGIGIASLLFYPLTWGTMVFSAVLIAYSVLAEHPALMNLKVAFVMSACISFCIGLADEADAPIRLDEATVITSNGNRLEGFYISSTAQTVYLGVDGSIKGTPIRNTDQLTITHPSEAEKSDPPSIVDRTLDGVEDLATEFPILLLANPRYLRLKSMRGAGVATDHLIATPGPHASRQEP